MASAPVVPGQGVMKSARSLRSMRSMRSTTGKSLAFSMVNFSDGTGVVPVDFQVFEDVLPDVCYKKYNSPFTVITRKEFRQDDVIKRLKGSDKVKKSKKAVVMSFVPHSLEEEDPKTQQNMSLSVDSGLDPSTKIVTAVYDNMNLKLCEIALFRVQEVPRLLIQAICVLAPMYDQLTKITICRCRIDAYTIYELQRYLPQTHITDVCLDESPLLEGNYALLLDKGTKIKTLSLSRCKINDAVCAEIASKLHFSNDAEKHLVVLDLSSNHITSAGAAHLSAALRTNRHLRYLSLADNRISDEGAAYIFNVLKAFPLTHEELLAERGRHTTYLKIKMGHYLKCLHTLVEDDAAHKVHKKHIGRKKFGPTAPATLKLRAEELTEKTLGAYSDPFAAAHMTRRDGAPQCRGNSELCYLNLAYNHLSFLSVKNLLTVVTYQSFMLDIHDFGLLRVVIDGNNIPDNIPELVSIAEVLNRNVSRFNVAASLSRRKSRSKLSQLTVPSADRAHEEGSRIATGNPSLMQTIK